ncbi:zf-TFIIB domain-containing protein [Candidatus Woesearchaeota archaeon]|nr:zf-TFIIB domain-containing protein [Candidatus Woesearchaeota archaeon]
MTIKPQNIECTRCKFSFQMFMFSGLRSYYCHQCRHKFDVGTK